MILILGVLACSAEIKLFDSAWDSIPLISMPDTGPEDSDADTDTDTDIDTTTGGDINTDCALLNPAPLSAEVIPDIPPSEDFVFDSEGYAINVDFQGTVVRTDINGNQQIVVPGAGYAAGIGLLPNGDLVVADVSNNALKRVDLDTGAVQVLVTGLAYPNGLSVGEDGFVYVAENSGGRLRRVDPDTGDDEVLAEGLLGPNGVTFAPDYDAIYVGAFGPGIVYRLELQSDGTWGEATEYAYVPPNENGPPAGALDGINTDSCGNVYVTEYVAGKVWRANTDGTVEEVVKLPAYWIPNMHWGRGVGGWRQDVLYVMDYSGSGLYAVEVGVKGRTEMGG